MKLQAITVCVNYSDFFIFSIENRKLFDKWIVITDMEDWKTRELCKKYNLTCVSTDVFYKFGVFNKFAAINEGLKLIDDDAWVLFIDGDIVLHPQTRRVLESLSLDKTCIYGMDRINAKGLPIWEVYLKGRGMLINYWLLYTSNLEMGARLVHLYGYENGDGEFKGYGPVGYFQLVHRSSFKNYPQNSLGADHCDLLFSRQYPRNKRILIPELFCIHLESEDAIKGHNWMGRKSKPFGDSLPVVTPIKKFCFKKIWKWVKKMLMLFLKWLFCTHHSY